MPYGNSGTDTEPSQMQNAPDNSFRRTKAAQWLQSECTFEAHVGTRYEGQ